MTGACPVCGETFRLYPDGRMKNHGPLGRPCDGSGAYAVGHEPAPEPDLIGRLVTPTPAWHRQAACRPELRPADVTPAEWTGLFFPVRGEDLTRARRVCLDCPVRDDCLTSALSDGEKHGVWGGPPREPDDRSGDVEPHDRCHLGVAGGWGRGCVVARRCPRE